jgi:hypothetical protein
MVSAGFDKRRATRRHVAGEGGDAHESSEIMT